MLLAPCPVLFAPCSMLIPTKPINHLTNQLFNQLAIQPANNQAVNQLIPKTTSFDNGSKGLKIDLSSRLNGLRNLTGQGHRQMKIHHASGSLMTFKFRLRSEDSSFSFLAFLSKKSLLRTADGLSTVSSGNCGNQNILLIL